MNVVSQKLNRDDDWRSQEPLDVESANQGDDVIDIKALLRTVWRRRGVILGTVVLLCALTVLLLVQMTPRYTATALLTLDLRQESVVDIEAVVSGLSPDTSVINTELDVLSSRRLLGNLVAQENLVADPEFNSDLEPESGLAHLLDPRTYLSAEWLVALGLSDLEEEPLTEEEERARTVATVIDAVGETLSVSNPGLSYTIRLSFETESARKSADLANALAELYLTDQLEAKFEATERATAWLNSRIGELRERVRVAELAVQQFREQQGIVQASERATVLQQQVEELNTQLTEAEADLAVAESRDEQVRTMRAAGNVAALGDVLASELIQRLREQEAEVRGRYAEVTGRYGERHPEVVDARAELSDIQGQIASEVSRIVTSVGNEVEIALTRVETLRARLDELEGASAETERAQVALRELEREAESSRVLLETFLSRFQETDTQQDLQQADARIISPADVPTEPSHPKKKLILAVTFVLALMIGFGLAFLLEALDHGYRTLDHLQKETRLKGLGMVPRLSRGRLRGKSPFEYVLSSPTSAYAEALRSVHTTLTFGQAPAPKSLVVTSSVPREGKTTFCLSLARLLARAGNRRVLFVEADLRRGDVRRQVWRQQPRVETLDGYLLGTVATWQECLVTDEASSLDMIVVSGQCDNAQALLQSDRMATLVREAHDRYDLIIYDSPPLLAVADAVLLSHLVDATVAVVRWENTAREGVRSAVSMLRKAEVRLAGVVMTQVDVRKHARYGYGDYASYYGRYGHYYTN